MGKNVTIAVYYGIQGEEMITNALELTHRDDKIHILISDFSSKEYKYNKEVDFEIFKNLAEDIGAELKIIRTSERNSLKKMIQYSRKVKTEHLIIGEDREQIQDLLLQGSLSNYILKRLPETFLTIIPYSKSVDNDYFDYSSGMRVLIKKEAGELVITDTLEEDYDFEGIYYKSNYTDFETGVVYINIDGRLVEKRVVEGKVKDMN